VAPQLNLITAFSAGLLSFVSPCVLPLIPAYLSFMTGSSIEELREQPGTAAKLRVLAHSAAFIAGFTLVFVAFGRLAGALGEALAAERDVIARVGGVLVIVLGLNMIGLFRIPFLLADKRLAFPSANRSYLASFLVGIGFAAGWSPCVGPILSAILLLAAQQKAGAATLLLLVYSAGLALPFFLMAALMSTALSIAGRIRRFLPAVEAGAGAFLIATGIVLVGNSFSRVAGFFYQYVRPPSL
jgi:cytochrome c-type biogenesis protein